MVSANAHMADLGIHPFWLVDLQLPIHGPKCGRGKRANPGKVFAATQLCHHQVLGLVKDLMFGSMG